MASAQSVADIARQEAARRKAITTPGKVYTNDNLRREPPSTASVPAPPAAAPAVQPQGAEPGQAAPAGAAEAAAAPPPAAAEPVRDEAYWRQRLTAEREALARAQIFAEALQSRINALTTDFVNRDDPAQRDVIAADRQTALAELERVQREIQDHQKAIAGIQEEARRAGVPPGWLR
ncbi:MAG: hypothetical protein HY657_15525 [Acidobacteria bacterium]|nr:hypothetical protein [Acidobacteriota bacterium]